MLHKRESNFEMFDILGLALEVNKNPLINGWPCMIWKQITLPIQSLKIELFIFKMTNRQGSHIASSPAVLCEEKKW